MNENQAKITLRSFLIGILLTIVFAVLTVYFSNRKDMIITASQIPVLPYVLVIVTVLLINPVCRLLRVIRPLTTAEILIVFMMLLVSSGISTFGLSAQLVPVIGNLYNRAFNNEQTKWNLHAEPFLEETFYLNEPGIRERAAAYRDVYLRAERAQSIYDAALLLTRVKERFDRTEQALAEAQAAPETEGKQDAVIRARTRLELAESALQEARDTWAAADPPDDLTPERVLAEYPDRIASLETEVNAAREALAELEESAFAKVQTFRRGLSRDKRAYPGILPAPDENGAMYVGRVRRLVYGKRSLGVLSDALAAVKQGAAPAATADMLRKASELLEPIAAAERLEEEKEALNAELARIQERRVNLGSEIEQLNEQKRSAPPSESGALDRRIAGLQKDRHQVDESYARIQSSMEQVKTRLDAAERVARTAAELESLAAELPSLSPEQARDRLLALMKEYRLFDASLMRFLAGDLPWSHWLRPLLLWGVVIGLTYIVLMTFNVLIFRQWAHNEKLIYPLAELTERLAGASDEDTAGRIPALFRNGLFWIGFAISAAFLGWNLVCYLDVVPDLKPLDLTHKWRNHVAKTAFQALSPNIRSEVFFTMIGLAFLIPKKISFSLWFFYIVYMVELLILCWTGHGVNENSFRAGWLNVMNFRTAQGGGALMIFSLVVLYKCRRYIFCALRPDSIRNLPPDERKELVVSSWLFLICSTGIVLFLWLVMGANLFHTLFFLGIILMITIGLIRAVTEGGILAFQAWTSPFHFMGTLFGMNKPWTASALFAPLMVYWSILFFDIKTFIAPAMANALKIRNDLRMRRGRFHLAVALAIAVAAVVAVLAEIMMSYARGADSMQSWFYTSFPRGIFGRLAAFATTPPEASLENSLWIGAGAVGMAALLYLRQFLFWMPHPIGMIMLVNPIMNAYWFSIFIGWVAKSLVSKYGNKDVYARVRGLFIGLIAGELIIVALAMLLSHIYGVNIPIDLNRN